MIQDHVWDFAQGVLQWIQLCTRVAAYVLYSLLLAAPSPAQNRLPVDLELVFAIDASSSIDIAEYALQLRGIAAALRDPDVLAAIARGEHGKIAVNLMIWAQPGYTPRETGWSTVSGPEDADALASRIAATPRRQFGGTGLGEGIRHAVSSLVTNAISAPRMVIDVSGDGRETEMAGAMLLPEARALAHEQGIVINGLAVLDEDAALETYYREKVRAGADSFVLTAQTYRDFADAMKLKLLREVSSSPTAMHDEFGLQPQSKLASAIDEIAQPAP